MDDVDKYPALYYVLGGGTCPTCDMNKEAPCCPAHPRDAPYYIDDTCDCGTSLRLCDFRGDDTWWDEWYCPQCDDGVHIDAPESFYRFLSGERHVY